MGLTGSAMQALIAGSFLHDVGKIGIPDAILLKPGKLDAAEMAIMRTHVGQGEEIAAGMGWLDGANAVVADVFDALCSKRPYKELTGFEAAMAILEKDTGSHFEM